MLLLATIDAVNFIATVTKAGILTKYEERGAYKFCNNNYLAYFIASEICANKDREAVQYCLEYSCFGINSTVLISRLSNTMEEGGFGHLKSYYFTGNTLSAIRNILSLDANAGK